MQTWSVFSMFLILCVWSLEKLNHDFFFVKFSVKFIEMYRLDTLLFLIALVSEMLEIPKAKVEAHFLKKHAFATKKCLA